MHKRDGFCVRGRQRKVLDLIFTFITVAIIVISGVALIGQLAGLHLYSVESGSMTPEYPVDSLIIVREVEPESIQPGDVITFVANADGMVVTHREILSSRLLQQRAMLMTSTMRCRCSGRTLWVKWYSGYRCWADLFR